MKELLNALNNDREDIVGFLAADMFLLRGGGKNEKNIDEFEKFANCKITVTFVPILGGDAGTILYKGKKFYFG